MKPQSTSLRDLFDAALALAPGERAAFLTEHCSDPAERVRIERLLAADADDGEPLSAEPADRLAAAIGEIDATHEWTPGSRIGAYELIEIIGEGGSSTVFRAARDLDGVRQDVALKLLHRGLYSPEAQRLFRRERQALAALSHPNIAHLIDGGVTETGVPFLVVEYVDGLPITQYAAEHQLGVRARLRLLAVVCRAVEAAHRNLIVHRDLKPSNILVTSDGRVKLLDFGIAKLLDEELADAAGATRSGYAPLTPGYAAPEQYGGGPVSTATDVYALGVVLHELLLGERPARRQPQRPSARVAELATDLWQLPAPRPSLRAALRGDLDNIVLKALAEEPEGRYATATELGEDIERHLGARPVSAHPPSHWYRTRKFVQRHRGGVALTAAFAIGLVASLVLAFWQARVAREQAARATEQARIAQQQTQRAEAVRDLLVGLFDAEIPRGPRADMPGTAELLERGAERALAELGDTPAVQSELLTALGRVYDHLALPDKGEPLLDAAVAAAQRVQPADPALLGAALSERGELELSRSRFAEAIALFEQALPLQRQADPDGLALAVTLDRHALALSLTGEHERAIASYEAALAIRRRHFPEGSPDILHSQHAIGNALERAGRYEQATDYLRQAADGALAHFGEHHVKSAHYLKNYATNLVSLRRYETAATLMTRAVAIERELYPAGSPDVSLGIYNLGTLELLHGRLQAARTLFEEARERNRAGGRDDSLGQTYVLGILARVHDLLGERPRALALLREAEGKAVRLVGDDHPRISTLRLERLRLQSPFDASAAAALATQMLVRPEQLARFRARAEPEAHYALALALDAQGDTAGADASLQRALDRLPDDRVDPLLLFIVAGAADRLRTQDRHDQAQALLREHLERSERELAPTHYALGELHLALAGLLAADAPAQAAEHARAAERAFQELPDAHPWRARAAALARQP